MRDAKLVGIGLLAAGIWLSWGPTWGTLQYVHDVLIRPDIGSDPPIDGPAAPLGMAMGAVVIAAGAKLARRPPGHADAP